jgi:hypothetical protein
MVITPGGKHNALWQIVLILAMAIQIFPRAETQRPRGLNENV